VRALRLAHMVDPPILLAVGEGSHDGG
jgi:hypothetical protein